MATPSPRFPAPNRSGRDGLLVGRSVHQLRGGRAVRDGNLEEPAAAVRVAVDQLRRGVERVVDRNDLTGDRRVDVADGLGRLELADSVTGSHLGALVGELDVDD